MAPQLYARLIRAIDPMRAEVSRREALKASLAAAMALGLAGPAGLARAAGRTQRRRIVVIGAGFAGLACADRLVALGHDVRVIEASSRVGGRVLTFQNATAIAPGRITEGGGELIGSNHPAWLAMAKRFGLSMRDVTEEEGDTPVLMDGVLLDNERVTWLFALMDAAFERMTQDARAIDASRPWDAPDALALDARTTRDWIESLGLDPLAANALDTQFRADNGVDTQKQSYLGNLAAVAGGGHEKYWTESEVYRCGEGNQALARALATQLGSRRIITGAPVTRLAKLASGAWRVECGSAAFEGEQVVLAVPPSVWNDIAFEPAFGLAQFTPQMGVNTKYLSVLDGPVWREHKRGPDALCDALVNMTWNCSDNQKGDGPLVLNAFNGGRDAEEARRLKASERGERYGAALERLYPGYSGALRSVRFMDWPGFKHTKASYSFPAPGELTSRGAMLHQDHDGLHLAGEHCCHAFVGYMEGALQSGLEVAERIHAEA